MQFFLNEKEAEINYISSKLILNLFFSTFLEVYRSKLGLRVFICPTSILKLNVDGCHFCGQVPIVSLFNVTLNC